MAPFRLIITIKGKILELLGVYICSGNCDESGHLVNTGKYFVRFFVSFGALKKVIEHVVQVNRTEIKTQHILNLPS